MQQFTTTPDMKKQFSYRKQYPCDYKQPQHTLPRGMTYITPVNIIGTTKQKKHFTPEELSSRSNVSISPRRIPLLNASNLSANLIPKSQYSYTPKGPLQQERERTCTFENFAHKQCNQCKTKNKENQSTSPFKLDISLVSTPRSQVKNPFKLALNTSSLELSEIQSHSIISSRGNYFKNNK